MLVHLTTARVQIGDCEQLLQPLAHTCWTCHAAMHKLLKVLRHCEHIWLCSAVLCSRACAALSAGLYALKKMTATIPGRFGWRAVITQSSSRSMPLLICPDIRYMTISFAVLLAVDKPEPTSHGREHVHCTIYNLGHCKQCHQATCIVICCTEPCSAQAMCIRSYMMT